MARYDFTHLQSLAIMIELQLQFFFIYKSALKEEHYSEK